MAENVNIVYAVDSFHFKNDVNEYLDVDVNHLENYITLKIDVSEQFSIDSIEELDLIYSKLKESLIKIGK
jgi:hypothetical protein